jgi:transcriptional regulator with XRE-family HTH domain
MTLGEAIAYMRATKGLNQGQLGALMRPHVVKQQVYRWEADVNRPNPSSMIQLANLFGIDPIQFEKDFAEDGHAQRPSTKSKEDSDLVTRLDQLEARLAKLEDNE